MQVNKLQAYTSEGLEQKRSLIKLAAEELWNLDFNKDLMENPALFAETGIALDSLPDLKLPTKHETFDRENCQILYSALEALDPRQAADERLWFTLAVGHYAEYTKARWRKKSNVTYSSHVSNHLFAPTSRNRFRDHAIARLWWIGRFVRRTFQEDQDRGYDVFFNLDADVMSSLLGRPNLVAFAPIARAIIGLTHEHFVADPSSFSRQTYREFLKSLDLENGRQLLSCAGNSEAELIVKSSFDKFF